MDNQAPIKTDVGETLHWVAIYWLVIGGAMLLWAGLPYAFLTIVIIVHALCLFWMWTIAPFVALLIGRKLWLKLRDKLAARRQQAEYAELIAMTAQLRAKYGLH